MSEDVVATNNNVCERKTMTSWPDSFPEGCPPGDAVEAVGQMYRLVDSSPPSSSDFASHAEQLAAGTIKKRRWADDCAAAGVSVYSDVTAVETVRLSAGPLRKKMVAIGDLSGSGVMKQTGATPSHHTWWRPANDAAWTTFAVSA
ncbi:MAG TPA: hypothetical protein VHC43_14075 [Mycobacteriales bacterium]|nr:hypothetical protein [Mycobacteriales bacterium]